MLTEKQIHELAQRNRVHYSKIIEAERHIQKNPFDHLQPDDPRFARVWGDKIKRSEDKMKKGKQDAEEKARELRLFEQRKQGMDKVHRKYTVV